MVALHIGAWFTWLCSDARIFDLTCIVIIAGCCETIVVRLHRIWRG
jgi:hypothetical protein